MNDLKGAHYGSVVGDQPRNLRDILKEIMNELKDFSATRLEVMKSEFQGTLASVKVAVPLVLISAILFFSAFLLFTAAAVAVVARAFAGSPLAWVFAFLIVGFVWMAAGALTVFFAYKQLRSKALFPKRTMEVLKADRAWLQSEANQAGSF